MEIANSRSHYSADVVVVKIEIRNSLVSFVDHGDGAEEMGILGRMGQTVELTPRVLANGKHN